MTHPITPPPELVKELQDLGNLDAIKRAYQAGADMELGECKQFMHDQDWLAIGMSPTLRMAELHNARRPSLKDQALNDLDNIQTHDQEGRQIIDLSNIRLALESLPQ